MKTIAKKFLFLMLLLLFLTYKAVAMDPRECFTIYGNLIDAEAFKQVIESEMDAVFVLQSKDGKTLLCVDSYNPRENEATVGEQFAATNSLNRDAVKKMRSVVRRMMFALPGVNYKIALHMPHIVFDNQGDYSDARSPVKIDIGDVLVTRDQDQDAARVLLYHIFWERVFMHSLRDYKAKSPHEEALKKEAKYMAVLSGKDEGKQALHCYNISTGELFITFKSTQFRLHIVTGVYGDQSADIDTVSRTETDLEWSRTRSTISARTGGTNFF